LDNPLNPIQQFIYSSGAEVELGGDLALAEAVGAELEGLLLQADALVVVVAAEVVAFGGVADELIMQVAKLLLQAEEAYVIRTVHFGAAALFYLF
jgi:hypothetical protein